MMETLTNAELRKLAETRGPHCVSIYLPTHRTGKETKQDPLRLKGLLDAAEGELTSAEMRSHDAKAMLEPARRLLDDALFWSHQADGLAVFVTPVRTQHFRLPHRFDDLSLVGGRFHITPLFPLINENATFYILAISPNRVRLLQASRDAVEQANVAGLPKDFEELGKFIDTERLLQFHTKAAPAGGGDRGRAAVFHGQGIGTDDAQWKKQLLDFCRMVDGKLQPALAESQAPLVLAADQSLIPIYRKANSYPHTTDEAVTGNPDELSEPQLRDAAWPIVRKQQRTVQSQALVGFGDAAAQDRAATAMEQILPAAIDGRIATLLIGDGCHCWGQFDSALRHMELHDERQAGDEDLVNTAAIAAYLQGADVYTYDLDRMPNRRSAAALYRY